MKTPRKAWKSRKWESRTRVRFKATRVPLWSRRARGDAETPDSGHLDLIFLNFSLATESHHVAQAAELGTWWSALCVRARYQTPSPISPIAEDGRAVDRRLADVAVIGGHVYDTSNAKTYIASPQKSRFGQRRQADCG